jgi:hypothetical protein
MGMEREKKACDSSRCDGDAFISTQTLSFEISLLGGIPYGYINIEDLYANHKKRNPRASEHIPVKNTHLPFL